MFDDTLMTRLCVNAPYILYFTLRLYCVKWSCEVNILVPLYSEQVVYSLGELNISTSPCSRQVICLPSGNGPW